MIDPTEQTTSERIQELERHIADLEEWLAAVASDMLDRTGNNSEERVA